MQRLAKLKMGSRFGFMVQKLGGVLDFRSLVRFCGTHIYSKELKLMQVASNQ